MHVTDIAINKALGIQAASPGDGQILVMPETPLHLNHVGTIHAGAQFALAEACSGEFLLRELGDAQDQVFAVLRSVEAKFRKPAHGNLRSSARFAGGSAGTLSGELTSRGRALITIFVEVTDAQGIVTMSGDYTWFLQRRTSDS